MAKPRTLTDKELEEYLGTPPVKVPVKEDTGFFGAIKDALDTQAWNMAYNVGDIARVAGAEDIGGAIAERAKRGVEENARKTEGFSTEGVGNVLGQGAGTMGLGLAAGALSGPLAPIVTPAVMALSALGQSYAGSRMEQEQNNETARGRALAMAIPSAAIEVALGPERMVAALLSQGKTQAAKEVARLGKLGLAKEAAKVGAAELGEEYLQMPFEQYGGRGAAGITPEALTEGFVRTTIEAPNIILGAGGMGGAVAKYNNVRQLRTQDRIKQLEQEAIKAEEQGNIDQQAAIEANLQALREQAAAEAQGELADYRAANAELPPSVPKSPWDALLTELGGQEQAPPAKPMTPWDMALAQLSGQQVPGATEDVVAGEQEVTEVDPMQDPELQRLTALAEEARIRMEAERARKTQPGDPGAGGEFPGLFPQEMEPFGYSEAPPTRNLGQPELFTLDGEPTQAALRGRAPTSDFGQQMLDISNQLRQSQEDAAYAQREQADAEQLEILKDKELRDNLRLPKTTKPALLRKIRTLIEEAGASNDPNAIYELVREMENLDAKGTKYATNVMDYLRAEYGDRANAPSFTLQPSGEVTQQAPAAQVELTPEEQKVFDFRYKAYPKAQEQFKALRPEVREKSEVVQDPDGRFRIKFDQGVGYAGEQGSLDLTIAPETPLGIKQAKVEAKVAKKGKKNDVAQTVPAVGQTVQPQGAVEAQNATQTQGAEAAQANVPETQGEVNAIQEQSATGVPVQPEAQAGEEIRGGDEVVQEASEESRPSQLAALLNQTVTERDVTSKGRKVSGKGEKQTTEAQTQEARDPESEWDEEYRTNENEPKFSELSDVLKVRWAGLVEARAARPIDFDDIVAVHRQNERAARAEKLVAPSIKKAQEETAEREMDSLGDYADQAPAGVGMDVVAQILSDPNTTLEQKIDRVLAVAVGKTYDVAALSAVANIAKTVIKGGTNIQVKYIDRQMPDAAIYNEQTGTLTIFRDGAHPKTFFHELMHGLTVARLNRGEKIANGTLKAESMEDQRLADVWKSMETILGRARAQLGTGPNAPYGLTNVYEMIAEAYTNPEFRQAMAKVAPVATLKIYEGGKTVRERLGSLWKDLLATIKSALVGVKPANRFATPMFDNALEQIIDMTPLVLSNKGTVEGGVVRMDKKAKEVPDDVKADRERVETFKAGMVGDTVDNITDLTQAASRQTMPNQRLTDILGPEIAKTIGDVYDKNVKGSLSNLKYKAIKAFGPLSAQLEKSYHGRKLKALLNLQSAAVQYLRTEFSRSFERNVLDTLGGKKPLIKGFDNAATVLSWAMRQRLNDPKYFEMIKSKLSQDTITRISAKLEGEYFFNSVADETAMLHKALMDLNTKEVNDILGDIFDTEVAKHKLIEDGVITVDYMAETLEGDGVADRNSHPYRVFDKDMSKADREKVVSAIRNAFVEQGKLALLSSATQQFHAKRSIDSRIFSMTIRPFGLDMATTSDTIGGIMHDYQQLMVDPNNKEAVAEAKELEKAVVVYLNEGKFTKNKGDKDYESVKEALKLLAPIRETLVKKGDKQGEFAKNVQDVFNTAQAIAVESPMITERLTSTIGGFYIPQQRQSPYRVGLKMYYKNKAGEAVPVSLRKDQYGAFLQSMETESQMKEFVSQFNKDMDKETFKVMDASGNVIENAYFVAEENTSIYDRMSDAPALFNARQFLRQLEMVNVKLSKKNTEKILKAMSKQHSKTLRNIQANSAYGADRDALKYIGQFMNNAAFRVSDNLYGGDIDSLLANSHPWNKATVENELEQWRLFLKSLPKDSVHIPTIKARISQLEDGVKMLEENPNWAEETKSLARDAVAAYRDENGRSPEKIEALRKWAAISMLGGNLGSVVTNLVGGGPAAISSLAFKNNKGFGGGYGIGRSAAEFGSALKDGLSFGTTLLRRDGLQTLERELLGGKDSNTAEYQIYSQMLQEIKSGKLQVGQALSLTQLANQGFSSKNAKLDRFTELYMKPFTASETAIRVGTFLAAARLEMQDQLQGRDFSKLSQAEQRVVTDAVFRKADSIVEAAQGNYETWAKGALLRDKVGGTFFMFMHYPMVQLQLLKNMDKRGQMMYLSLLFLLSGADGLPFSDDLKNLYNALAKLFPSTFKGSDSRKIWLDATNGLEDATGVPSELVRKGALSALTGYDFSSLGMGSILRGDKGISDKAGIVDTLGPGAAFIMGMKDAGIELAKAGSAATDGNTETAKEHLMRAAKSSPIKAMKAFAGAADIGDDGRASTRAGLTVTDGLTDMDALVRGVGFRSLKESEGYEKADIIQARREFQIELQKSINNLATVALIEKNPELRKEVIEKVKGLRETFAGTGITVKLDWAYIREQAAKGKLDIAERAATKMQKSQQAEAMQFARE